MEKVFVTMGIWRNERSLFSSAKCSLNPHGFDEVMNLLLRSFASTCLVIAEALDKVNDVGLSFLNFIHAYLCNFLLPTNTAIDLSISRVTLSPLLKAQAEGQ
jgi:hypothetical protein